MFKNKKHPIKIYSCKNKRKNLPPSKKNKPPNMHLSFYNTS